MSKMNPIFSCEGLTFSHTRSALYAPLALHIEAGETLALLGRNGAGKSTFLKTLLGTIPALSGHITQPKPLGFVAQEVPTQIYYSVFDMVLMGRAAHIGLLKKPSEHDLKATENALHTLGILSWRDRSFAELSGGQRQLVMMARALATGAPMLLLDEPMSALDWSAQNRVLALIDQLAREENKTIIFSTHDPLHASLVAQKVLLLYPDQTWQFGPTSELIAP